MSKFPNQAQPTVLQNFLSQSLSVTSTVAGVGATLRKECPVWTLQPQCHLQQIHVPVIDRFMNLVQAPIMPGGSLKVISIDVFDIVYEFPPSIYDPWSLSIPRYYL